MAAEGDTERVGVRTYVPRSQRETWEREAESMDMSRAEYVRTMVQAGRRSFDFGVCEGNGTSNPEEGDGAPSTPGVDGLEERLLGLLESGDHYSWEDLVAGLTDDIEDRLEEALGDLQQRNRVQYSGRHGGYTLTDDGE